MHRNRFLFCECLDRTYHYALARGIDVPSRPYRPTITLCNHFECVHGARNTDASDKVRAVDTDEDAPKRRRVVEIDFTPSNPRVPIRELPFCTFNIDTTAVDEGHDFESLPAPNDRRDITRVHLCKEPAHDLRNVTWTLDDLFASYTDGVLFTFIESSQERGVYTFQHGDSVHRFFDEFSHQIPVILAVLKAFQSKFPHPFDPLACSDHCVRLSPDTRSDCIEDHK